MRMSDWCSDVCSSDLVDFCDIDEFKKVNDLHGHEAGDRVIKAIADTLARISNDQCHVARHGGEEFVMLFRGLTPTEAAAKLDDAREALADRRLINRQTDQPFGQITFSGDRKSTRLNSSHQWAPRIPSP